MNLIAIKEKADSLFSEVRFLSEIKNMEEHTDALALMDQLFDDYDHCEPLINVLSATIARYEESAPEFQEFNKGLSELDSGISMLKVLMSNHNLVSADFEEEIGDASLVDDILSEKIPLTHKHIENLSKRFNINPSMFFN